MKKKDLGTSTLEAPVHELQGKTITNKGSFRKIAAPVSSGLFLSRVEGLSCSFKQLPWVRRADLTSDAMEETSDSYSQKVSNKDEIWTHVCHTKPFSSNEYYDQD